MSIKSDLICRVCNQILGDPVFLPCFCASICNAHTTTLNEITCEICHEVLNLSKESLKPNKTLRSIIEKNGHLSEEEKKAKAKVKEFIDEVQELINKIEEKQLNIEVIHYEKFSDLKRDIDLRRENLKLKIDEIYMEMIEKVEKIEKKSKPNYESGQLNGKQVDIQKEKELLNDLFRNPTVKLNEVNDLEIRIKELQNNLKSIQLKYETEDVFKFEFDFMFTNESFGTLKTSDTTDITMSDKLIISSQDLNEIFIYDLKANNYSKKITGHSDGVESLIIYKNTQLISGSLDNSIKMWDIETGTCLGTLIGHTNSVFCLKLIDKNYLASGSADKTIMIWHLLTGRHVNTLLRHGGPVNCLEILPNGLLASGSDDKFIKIWDPHCDKHLKILRGHTDLVKSLKFLHDSLLASGSADGHVMIWNSETGQLIQVLYGHIDTVFSLELIHGEQLISVSKEIKIWSLKDYSCILTFGQNSDDINCVKFDEKSSQLVSCSKDIKIWDLKSGECLKTIINIYDFEVNQIEIHHA